MTSNNNPGFSLSGLSTKAKIGIGCGSFFALMFITAGCAAVVDTLVNGPPEEEPTVAETEPTPEPKAEEPVEEETQETQEPEPSLAEAVEEQAIEIMGSGNDPYEWWDLVTGWEDGDPGEVLVSTSLPSDTPYVNGEDGITSMSVAEEMCIDLVFLKALGVEGIERVEIQNEADQAMWGCEPFT